MTAILARCRCASCKPARSAGKEVGSKSVATRMLRYICVFLVRSSSTIIQGPQLLARTASRRAAGSAAVMPACHRSPGGAFKAARRQDGRVMCELPVHVRNSSMEVWSQHRSVNPSPELILGRRGQVPHDKCRLGVSGLLIECRDYCLDASLVVAQPPLDAACPRRRTSRHHQRHSRCDEMYRVFGQADAQHDREQAKGCERYADAVQQSRPGVETPVVLDHSSNLLLDRANHGSLLSATIRRHPATPLSVAGCRRGKSTVSSAPKQGSLMRVSPPCPRATSCAMDGPAPVSCFTHDRSRTSCARRCAVPSMRSARR